MNLTFKWETGSKNSNAMRVFKQYGIMHQYSKYGEMQVMYQGKWHNVEYKALGNDVFEIVVI